LLFLHDPLMATRKTLKDVLDRLASPKVKERTEGLAALKDVLERDSALNQLDDGQGKTWLAIFQHVFGIVLNEKGACVKKTTKNLSSGNAAQTRLRAAAETVRWLVERCLQRLGRKAIISILVHLLQTIRHEGQLYEPVALHYIKAMRSIVSYTPHLEHIDPGTWTRIVEMCWNIVLGDPLRKRLDAQEEDYTDDIEMVDGEEVKGSDEEDAVPSPKKKRRKRDTEDEADEPTSPRKARKRDASATPGPSNRVTPFYMSTQPVTHEQVECTALLAILLRNPCAPVLTADAEGKEALATQLLERHLRFIQRFPADTSLHQNFLICLSATLSHLALNKRDAVTSFARLAWDGLLGMWSNKNKSLKEHLVVVLRALLPYYTSSNLSDPNEVPFDYTGGLASLWSILGAEVDHRRGFEGLSLDCLRLQLHRSEEESDGAFMARTYRHGSNFDSMQAFAWSILELQADCASKVSTDNFHFALIRAHLCRSCLSLPKTSTMSAKPRRSARASVQSSKIRLPRSSTRSSSRPTQPRARFTCRPYSSSSIAIGLSFTRNCARVSCSHSCS
jgi:ataxia telangiectasia mutated family protein